MVHIETSGWRMVRIMSARATREYAVYDVEGKPLGRVVEPEGTPRMGPGAATVFLDRTPGEHLPAA
jgi:hypothetical protein